MKIVIHLVPFDKFAWDLVIALQEAHECPIFYLIGSPDHTVSPEALRYFSKLDNVFYLNKKHSLFKVILNYTVRILNLRDRPLIVSHATDIFACKYLLFISFLFKAKYLWHVRGNDLYRHLLDCSLPLYIRILNLILYKHAYSYLSISSSEKFLINSVFGSDRFIRMICSPSNVLFSNTHVNSLGSSILIGNSATTTSNIASFMSLYSNYIASNSQKMFWLVGSYGTPHIIDEYIAYANEFKNVFVQTQFMSLQDYNNWLSSFNIAVLIPTRLQGLGQLFMLITSGITIYTHHTSPLSSFMDEYSITYKTLSSSNFALDPLPSEDLHLNRTNVAKYFNYNNLIDQWKQIQFL